jgi:hypothetical protein
MPTNLKFNANVNPPQAPFIESGGAIYQTSTTETPAQGGKVSYRFLVREDSDCTISMEVSAPGADSNSLFISVDREPTVADKWEIPETTNGFEPRTVPWQFPLTFGDHTLIIRGCTANTKFSSLTCTHLNTLGIHPLNPRYFTDNSRDPILFAGSHTWWLMQSGSTDGHATLNPSTSLSRTIDFLDYVQGFGHNYVRYWQGFSYANYMPKTNFPWVWDNGTSKFNLNNFNQSYFDDLSACIAEIERRNMYAGVIIFGSAVGIRSNFGNVAWSDTKNSNGLGFTSVDTFFNAHTSDNVRRAAQCALIRKTVDTLNNFDNIVWEIINEANEAGKEWQYWMIDYLRQYEAEQKPKQHLIGIGGIQDYDDDESSDVFELGVNEWVSPENSTNPNSYDDQSGSYRKMGGLADYRGKVVIVDSDHLFGYSTSGQATSMRHAVYRSFTRGNHYILMDQYNCYSPAQGYDGIIDGWLNPIRVAMGVILKYSKKIDLAKAIPTSSTGAPGDSDTGYCLRNLEDGEYIAYNSANQSITLRDIEGGTYSYECIDAITGNVPLSGDKIHDNGDLTFPVPGVGVSSDWLLYVKKID